MSESKVLGVLIMARHGDRQGFYQNPTDYAPTGTKITPLGNQEEFFLGQKLRDRYFNQSADTFISGVNSSIVDLNQILVRADAGGEGGVILNSAFSLMQGMFPANPDYTTTLANGTKITGPLNGYQYVAVESVEPENDISLEGWTKCGAFDQATKAFYASAPFKQKAEEAAPFLSQLPKYLDGRPVTLENMWNIFDFMNVQNIHSADFHNNLPSTFLEQARHLANYHEYGVFSDKDLNGIGNIAFRTLIPSFAKNLNKIANTSDPLKFVYQATAYKPFLSFFNMTGVAQMNPDLAGIVNYAGTIALEVRQPADGSAPVVRFNFKNGTQEESYKTYPFMNSQSGEVPLKQFVSFLQPYAVNETADWCKVCGNSMDRGCGALALAASEAGSHGSGSQSHQKISPVGAGFLGAGLALVVALLALAALFFLGVLTFGKKSKRTVDSDSDREKA